eukprot:c11770_g6_i1.p1 GENE.c11770_g6_i1~~c11770_g6_i1.p1  ORF type:complete len:545 (-),score=188.34 c11770_g6_i1:128-1762(-)
MSKQKSINLGMNGLSDMLKEGTKHYQGIDEAVAKNLQACKQLADMTRTSLGPQGRNKMVINHINKLFVTSDAATIVKELEIAHPAANMVMLAAKQQEEEVGDGSNLCIVLAGEVLFNAAALLRMGLHVSEIIKGYELAFAKALEVLGSLPTTAVSSFTSEPELARALRGAVATKMFGYDQFLSDLIAKACVVAMPENPKNFIVDNVRVCKIPGLSVLQSTVVKGMVFTKTPLGTVKQVSNCKVAVFACAVDAANTDTKGTVLINSADELKNYNKTEEVHMEKIIKAIAETGAKLIISGSSVGEMAAHFIERYGLMCLKIMSKYELRRFCRTVGATALTELRKPTPEELGHVGDAKEEEIGGTKCTVVRQSENDTCAVATLVLRAATTNMLDDIERAVDDGVNCVRCLVKDNKLLIGAGATEIEIARQVGKYADSFPGLEQYAIKKFAEAFEVVPRTLSENAGLVPANILSTLYARHNNGEYTYGIDVESGCVGETDTVDLFVAKDTAIRLAVDAALTVLRVDQIIMSKPAGGPKAPQQGGRDDE